MGRLRSPSSRMMTHCEGCNAVFKCSSLHPHLPKSHNLQCKQYRFKLDNDPLVQKNNGKMDLVKTDGKPLNGQ